MIAYIKVLMVVCIHEIFIGSMEYTIIYGGWSQHTCRFNFKFKLLRVNILSLKMQLSETFKTR